MSIGKNIAKYRKISGLTQEELGIKLGVTNQAVSKWESEISMPDIMLLPKIADALGITLYDIYGISDKSEKSSVSADDFPMLCHKKLHELFHHNTRMRFSCAGVSDSDQLDYQRKRLAEGLRIGCVSNSNGAVVMTDDFAFVDLDYKNSGSENIIRNAGDEYTLMYLTDQNLRKVLFYEYKTAMEKSKESNAAFSLEEIVNECGLTEAEAAAALRLMCDANLNEIYKDHATGEWQYILKYSTAVYAMAIYRLAGLLAEDDPVWLVVRDTTIVDDLAF